MAQNRALQRVWLACLNAGDPDCATTNPTIQNFTWALLKAPEHTWGTPGISGWGGGNDYDAKKFRAALNTQPYMRAAASWAEQRFFNELAVRALEEAKPRHKLADDARAALEALVNVQTPVHDGFTGISLTSPVTATTGAEIVFATDGSIKSLKDGQTEWAGPDGLMGYVYQTFNETEWKPFTYAYINGHTESGGFCKPGSNNFSESAYWRPTLTALYIKGTTDNATEILAEMTMPDKAKSTYGAPSTVTLALSFSRVGTAQKIDAALYTMGKQPTMIGESSSVTFSPGPTLRPTKPKASAWSIDKLGFDVDPEGVQDGGNQFNHATWKGATATTELGSINIESLDAVNFNPITSEFPIGNPLPASYKEATAKSGKGLSRLAPGSVTGMAVNLHNNLWNTNYPLYYPYFDQQFCKDPLDCRNANSLFRFVLTLTPVPF